MSHTPSPQHNEIDDLPPTLRALLDAELAAGNSVVEVGHTHPAPPIGAYFRLARPVTTRARASGGGLDFRERNSSDCCGEFSDADRRYFLLESPTDPEAAGAYPDMDAIREAANASQHNAVIESNAADAPASPRDRFYESTNLTYERWHDGAGYDLDALSAMSAEEQADAEVRLSALLNWRDVEALAHLDTPKARRRLAAAARDGNAEIRMAVLRYAPSLVDHATRTESLVRALADGKIYHGLSEALDEIENFHPPAVERALWRAARYAAGDVAYHAGTTLLLIHGKIASRFDWAFRPQMLLLNTENDHERERAFESLCEVLGTDSTTALSQSL